jgi:hypothetical protein
VRHVAARRGADRRRPAAPRSPAAMKTGAAPCSRACLRQPCTCWR